MEKLIFLHIPKTAGSTFHSILNRNYRESIFTTHPFEQHYFPETTENYLKYSLDEFNAISKKDLGKFNMVKGHFLFGLHERLDSGFKYITFFRDPIERLVSNYNYLRKIKSNKRKFASLSLIDFVNHNMDLSVRNLQTRMIAGVPIDLPVEEHHLSLAISNIDNHFSFVGLTEFFDDSLIAMKEKFNWKYIFYKKLNQAPKSSSLSKIDTSLTTSMIKLNQLDMKLYNYVRSKFEGELLQLGDINSKRRWQQIQNRMVSPFLKHETW